MIERFKTARLSVEAWGAALSDPASCARLEQDLVRVLTPEVLRHLPPSLQLAQSRGVQDWIDARAAESDVLLVRGGVDADLVGLVILAQGDAAAVPVWHLGYLLAERFWGQGFASELVEGMVAAFGDHPPVDILAGVERANLASARVLEKAGFRVVPDAAKAETVMYRCALR